MVFLAKMGIETVFGGKVFSVLEPKIKLHEAQIYTLKKVILNLPLLTSLISSSVKL